MKRTILSLFLPTMAFIAMAQDPAFGGLVLDAAEDTTHVVTIADIVSQQSKLTSQHSTSSHFNKVWGYKSYFNMSYLNDATLKPDGMIILGYDGINDNHVPDFKADYGIALQLGHSYNLHKQPIANTVSINLDYTYIDLSMAHYKQEPGEYVYNSDNTWDEITKNGATSKMQYIPWCLEKYDINYGMHLGPSLTVAPFTYLKEPQLHFFKLNFYYHIGYQVGVLWMINNKDADAAQAPSSYYNESDPMKLNWQHGLVNSYGASLSWKTIGIGFETRSDTRTYKSFDATTYGKKKYKFKGNNSRIYLKICY